MIALICDKCGMKEEHLTGSDMSDFKLIGVYNMLADYDKETDEDVLIKVALCSDCYKKYKTIQVKDTKEFLNIKDN